MPDVYKPVKKAADINSETTYYIVIGLLPEERVYTQLGKINIIEQAYQGSPAKLRITDSNGNEYFTFTFENNGFTLIEKYDPRWKAVLPIGPLVTKSQEGGRRKSRRHRRRSASRRN
jgi:hypothetical protein